MPDRILADCATAHRSKSSIESPTTDTQLDSAVAVAGEQPELAESLARSLRIGEPESILHQALRREALPPVMYDHWFDPPPAGSFDAGIARVMGEQYIADFAWWTRTQGLKFTGDFTDPTDAVQEEVKRSYGFARYACSLASSIRLAQQDGESEEEQQQIAEHDLSLSTATAFLAGWYMGQEHSDMQMSARASKGDVKELVDLLRRKLHPGAASPDVFLSRGYWTEDQIATALDRVRAIEAPEEHVQPQTAAIGGAR